MKEVAKKEVIESYDVAAATPMMRQYISIKDAHRDYLLFYRMGDFYELFFDDAIKAASALDIALTRRGKHEGQDIPMCGVPVHSHESYLHRLIEKGFKVAVCEQMEDPAEAKKRGYKSVVRREVTRIVTPGTVTEDSLLDSRSSNYLLVVNQVRDEIGLAWADISTGAFYSSVISANSLASELSRINPSEIILPDNMLENKELIASLQDWKQFFTPHVASFFDAIKGERKIKDFFEVSSLESFGNFSRVELGSCGALIEYLELTQKGKKPRLSVPRKLGLNNQMIIDSATRKNLEIVRNSSGEYKGSLLSIIDKTVTGPGARLLFNYIGSPLLEPEAINNRLDMVEFFIVNPGIRQKLRENLKRTPDMERVLSRLYLKRGGPADISSIRDGLKQVLLISNLLELCDVENMPMGIKTYLKQLDNHDLLLIELENSLEENVGYQLHNGGFIKEGYNLKLDDYRNARANSEKIKQELRDKYSKEAGVDKLKIKDNNVLGYFIEVTAVNADKIPDHFIHRQTLAGVVRYTTAELRELENKIINASSYALELELQIFQQIAELIISDMESIVLSAQSLAGLDVMAGFAEIASEKKYCRPVLDRSEDFIIKSGRHPVVEVFTEGRFISNDCNLSKDKIWLLTGPNMAGKSTFLRQNAIITILAQTGSFVPADEVRIGVIDRVFSRVGAADDLAHGRSTFMVEMVETSTILNNATDRSLVILDEIGRGTATFDGLSIAWAVIEHIHGKNKCRCLFATHYHELNNLAEKLENLSCHTVKVREWEGKVIFMHEVIAGAADRSYGIYVAKIAGLPEEVIKRAEEILKIIQEGESSVAITSLARELPLFSTRIISAEEKSQDEIIKILNETKPDELTARSALDLVYSLIEKLQSK